MCVMSGLCITLLGQVLGGPEEERESRLLGTLQCPCHECFMLLGTLRGPCHEYFMLLGTLQCPCHECFMLLGTL